MNGDSNIITWEEVFVTGIPHIDQQHKELVSLTNELYKACLSGKESVGPAFKEIMSRMVEYVRFHFTAELQLLKRINYPDYNNHKAEHDNLVKQILTAVNEYQSGKKYAPYSFVRTLKDWVFGHIAVTDKLYSAYVAEQKSKGILSDKDLV